MKASVVDLRYKMNDVLKALDRNEKVTILYHGKEKAMIIPSRKRPSKKVQEHLFFGMIQEEEISVDHQIEMLRGGRYHVI